MRVAILILARSCVLILHDQGRRRIKAWQPSTPAAAKVIGVPELLENILLHLGMQQLFVVQRVNRTFKEVIRGSRRLQHAMFLLHDDRQRGDNMPNPPNPILDGCLPFLGRFDFKSRDISRDLVCLDFEESRRMTELDLSAYAGAKGQSWRQTKVTAAPAKLTICLNESGGIAGMGRTFYSVGGQRYEDLGEVADWLALMITIKW